MMFPKQSLFSSKPDGEVPGERPKCGGKNDNSLDKFQIGVKIKINCI